MKQVQAESRESWRAWLAANGATSQEVWLVFPKAHTGQASVDYNASVEEALCFGWIDSLIRRIDEDRFARKFTPRKSGSVWSEANKARAERMMAAGRMTRVGQALIDEAKASGEWDRIHQRPRPSAQVPTELAQALKRHPQAAAFFDSLAPTYRRQYCLWIEMAKRPDTTARRVAEAIEKLGRGEKLGLK